MKNIFWILAVAFAFTACSDDNVPGDDGPGEKPFDGEVISFETSEGMTDIAGKPVVLGDIEVDGGSAAGTHHRVFWAKGGSFTDLMDGTVYDGYLCSTADENIWFGTYFSANTGYGDYWGGFVLTANYGKTATTLDYKNQFVVWADEGACDTPTSMIGYDCSYTGGPEYAAPTIDFVEPRTVDHLYMANTAITYTYVPSVVDAAAYYYKVVVIGSLRGVETGRVECVLVSGASKVKDWTRVDISVLGKVDCLKFKPETNDANSYGPLAPCYFAVDEIGYLNE